MPRANWEEGAEIVKNDLNAVSKALQREFNDRALFELVQRAENSFFSDSFLVQYAATNSVLVKKGVGFQSDSTQVSPEPTKRLLYRSADVAKLITTPDSSDDRIDIVCVKSAVVTELSGSRKYKDASTNEISNQNLVIQKDWEAEIILVDGTPDVAPTPPAVPSGYIKIAELYVTAVSGLAGSGAVTDYRSLMPVGSQTTINTVGFERLPDGAATSLDDLFASIDAYLKNGYQEFTDFDVLVADPAAPDADKVRIYFKGGLLYFIDESSVVTPIGSGGGGGGSLKWFGPAGSGPVEDEEYGEQVFMFEKDQTQKIVAFIKIPESFIAGRQMSMIVGAYSPAAANQFKLQAVTTLIRKNNDAVDSTTNQNTANTGDITNAVAKRFRNLTINLSSSLGAINSIAVSAGDLIKVEISRIAPGGSEDTEDIRFIPNATEVKFG